MDVRNEAGVENRGGLENGEMELINRLARRELKGSEVYVFQLRLCDNEIDREGERFSRETLEGLAPLFVGKSGIFDHNWSAGGQTARIYRTEVVEEPGKVTGAGDGACFLKGWAYMLRTPGNEELIAQIEGGIKREVSVGCAVERSVCSVCGEEMGSCRHVKGRTYNGKLCWAELTGAKDAYEWSFVAVPAQRGAGVMKALSPALKELARGNGRAMEELLELEKEARMGRRYLDQLRREVIRLAAVSEPGLETRVVRAMVDKLGEEELEAMKRLFSHQGRERLEGGAQLTYPGTGTAERAGDGAFLV